MLDVCRVAAFYPEHGKSCRNFNLLDQACEAWPQLWPADIKVAPALDPA
jgi:hypothetical protein